MMRVRSTLRLLSISIAACGFLGSTGARNALAQGAEPPPNVAAPAPSASFPVAGPQPAAADAAKDANAARVEEADRLFKRGVERMDSGDFATTCPLLEQSQAADPSSGTLLNLGDCYEHLGRTASADGAFAQAIELAKAAGRQDRVQVAEVRRARLATQLRRFRIVAPAGSNPSVTLDQKPITQLTDPIAVDPGTHELRASAPGFSDYFAQVGAPNAGVTLDLRIPELTPIAGAPTSSVDTRVESGANGFDGRQVAALTCGAVGILGVVGGTVFGLRSIAKHDESDEYCKGSACWDQRGVDAMESARSAGTLSTVSFIVGGAGLGAAAVLWFVRPKPANAVSAQLGVLPGAVELRGTF